MAPSTSTQPCPFSTWERMAPMHGRQRAIVAVRDVPSSVLHLTTLTPSEVREEEGEED